MLATNMEWVWLLIAGHWHLDEYKITSEPWSTRSSSPEAEILQLFMYGSTHASQPQCHLHFRVESDRTRKAIHTELQVTLRLTCMSGQQDRVLTRLQICSSSSTWTIMWRNKLMWKVRNHVKMQLSRQASLKKREENGSQAAGTFISFGFRLLVNLMHKWMLAITMGWVWWLDAGNWHGLIRSPDVHGQQDRVLARLQICSSSSTRTIMWRNKAMWKVRNHVTMGFVQMIA